MKLIIWNLFKSLKTGHLRCYFGLQHSVDSIFHLSSIQIVKFKTLDSDTIVRFQIYRFFTFILRLSYFWAWQRCTIKVFEWLTFSSNPKKSSTLQRYAHNLYWSFFLQIFLVGNGLHFYCFNTKMHLRKHAAFFRNVVLWL